MLNTRRPWRLFIYFSFYSAKTFQLSLRYIFLYIYVCTCVFISEKQLVVRGWGGEELWNRSLLSLLLPEGMVTWTVVAGRSEVLGWEWMSAMAQRRVRKLTFLLRIRLSGIPPSPSLLCLSITSVWLCPHFCMITEFSSRRLRDLFFKDVLNCWCWELSTFLVAC